MVALALLLAGPAEAGFYSWTDENGQMHFTDDPSNIPAPYRQKNDIKKHTDSPGAPLQPGPTPEVADNLPVHEVDLVQILGGNFMVDVVLNGKVKAHLMVDTGSSMVILSRDIGKKLGFSENSRTPKLPTMTAGGMVWTPMTVLHTLRVGDAESEFVEAGFNDQIMGMDGLLGMSFLGDFRMEMDRHRAKMKLSPLIKEGETLWGGKPGSWWKNRLRTYTSKIEEIETGAGYMEITNHPDARKLRKLVDYYREMKSQLMNRARRAGVPSKFLH